MANSYTVALYRPDGELVDAIEFGPQTNDVSQGRWPDGVEGSFFSFTVPTPGSPNGDTNRPFRITSIVRGQGDELFTADPPANAYNPSAIL